MLDPKPVSIALGRDIHDWLVRGLEHVALDTPHPKTAEMHAALTLLRQAQLVILLMPAKLTDA